MRLIALCGLPGVGKFSVARELCHLTNFANFHNHLAVDAAASLFTFGSPAFVKLREEIWLRCLTLASRERDLGVIFTYAYDRTVRPRTLNKIDDLITRSGGLTSWIELTCSRTELEKRICAPERQSFKKIASLNEFRKLEAMGAFPRPVFPSDPMVLDTTNTSPSDAAATILEMIDI
jgi:predicted kinase